MKIAKSMVAFFLILASLVSLVPTALGVEKEERMQITVNGTELEEMLNDEADADAYEQSIKEALYEQYGLEIPEAEDTEFGYLSDEECRELGIEIDPAKRDVRNEENFAYIFLDFLPGSASRNFNWQVQSDSSKANYFAANPQGVLGAYYSGTDPRLYMPIEDVESYIVDRLKNYKIDKNDIIQVGVWSVTKPDSNDPPKYFPKNGSNVYKSYFTIVTEESILKTGNSRYISCGTTNFVGHNGSQVLQWNMPDAQHGKYLRFVRWDPIQPNDSTLIKEATGLDDLTRIYTDYIYVGPPSTAPCKVEFLKMGSESVASQNADMASYLLASNSKGYVGYGKKATAWSTGKVNTEDEAAKTQTIYGWAVWQDTNKDGVYENQKKFITDSSSFVCKHNTRFVLTEVTIRKETLNSKQTYTTGDTEEEKNDDKYSLTVDGFDTAELNLGGYGTPLDVAILMDRSGSQADRLTNYDCKTYADVEKYLKKLSKAVHPGYYRATCFRVNKEDGTGRQTFDIFRYTMPMRYYRGEWQMQILKGCNCNTDSKGYQYDWSYGIYMNKSTGMTPCDHVKWVSMKDGFEDFVDDADSNRLLAWNNAKGFKVGSTYNINGKNCVLYFSFGASRLGRAQNAIVSFMANLHKSTPNLMPGENHTVSLVGYGSTVFMDSYPFYTEKKDEDTGKKIYSTKNNYGKVTKATEKLTYSNYESYISAIRNTYVIGATSTDYAIQVLTGEKSDIEKNAGTGLTTENTELTYLPAANKKRTRVVLLVTDGTPSRTGNGTTFDSAVATAAIASARKLKVTYLTDPETGKYVLTNDGKKIEVPDENTLLYAVAILDDLNSDNYYVSSPATEADKINNFMNLVSSRYPMATAYNKNGGTKQTGAYYIADKSAGSDLTDHLKTIWNDRAPSLNISGLSGPGALWLYEEFSREWKPDPNAKIKIWAAPYTKNGTYGEKVLLGEHSIEEFSQANPIAGKGYKLHYTTFPDQRFAYSLQWSDAKKAFLRETKLDLGCAAVPLSGTLDTTLGYKIFMEMPIEVDRNNTMGGNNIPLTKNTSGCYQSKDSADSGMNTNKRLYAYEIPDANVSCEITTNGYDYFVPMETYLQYLEKGVPAGDLEKVIKSMIDFPDDSKMKPANSQGNSNLDWVSFDVSLKAPDGTVLYSRAADFGDVSLRSSTNILDGMADLTREHQFTMVAKMTHRSNEEDSFGRPAYPNVDITIAPTYYVPQVAVVDYGDDLRANLTGMEGRDLTRINNTGTGATPGVIHFGYGTGIMTGSDHTVPYTYQTYNKPKGATTDVVDRELIVIPGSVMTYDDTFVNFSADWTTEGQRETIVQVFDNDSAHGQDSGDGYITTGDFHGSVQVVSVDKSKPSKQGTFSFTGTGFEIMSRTAQDSGVMVVEVFEGNEILKEKLLKSILCNTYYANGTYYQVPVIQWHGDTHGEYTVRITAYYNAAFAGRAEKGALTEAEVKELLGYDESVDFTYIPGESRRATRKIIDSYNVYVDGIRIFNTLGDLEKAGTLAKIAYAYAGEGYSNLTDLRDFLIHSGNWDGNLEDEKMGMLYMSDLDASVDNGDTNIGVEENGFPLLMSGKIETETVTVVGRTGETETRTYFIDKKTGQRITDTNGREMWSMASSTGGRYYYTDNREFPDGSYVIAAKIGDTYYALPNNFSASSNVQGVPVTVDKGKVSLEDASPFVFNITKNSFGYNIASEQSYVDCADDQVNLSTFNMIWMFQQGKNGTFRFRCGGENHYIMYREGGFCLVAADDYETIGMCYDLEILPVDGANDGSEKYNPYKTLSRDYVREMILGEDSYFYTGTYVSYGPKTEIFLKPETGVAFASNGNKVFLSVKSADGGSCCLEVWNGEEWENYKDPAGKTPLTNITTATEMFYDFSHYFTAQNDSIAIRNNGSGMLSIVHLKTIGEKKGVTINQAAVMMAFKAFETELDEPVDEMDVKLSHSLNLESNISINYVVSKAAVEELDLLSLVCRVGEEVYELTPEERGELLYFTLDTLNATRMADVVEATLYGFRGGVKVASPVDEYSITAYAFNMLNRAGVSEKLKAVCANLLRYGAASQLYKGYNVDALADEELSMDHRAYLQDLDSVEFGNHYAIVNDVTEPAVKWFGKALTLDSTVAVKFVADLSGFEGEAADLIARVSYVDIHGETRELTIAPTVYNAAGKLYAFTVDQLPAAELRAVLNVQIFYGDEAVSQTMTYSADTYGNGKTGKLGELCKALFAYVDAAKALFEN